MSPHNISLRAMYAGQTGKKKAKVVVAMSGGIDSSVAAALLKKALLPILALNVTDSLSLEFYFKKQNLLGLIF